MKLVTFVLAAEPSPSPRVGVVVERVAGSSDEAPILDLTTAFSLSESEAGRSADLAAVQSRYGADMIGLIAKEELALPTVRALLGRAQSGSLPASFGGAPLCHARAAVQLLAPIPRPLSMRDGYAFRQHVEAARRNRGLPMIPEFDELPIFYYTNHLSVIGPGAVRVRTLHLDQLDFELEAAIVVGKTLRDADIQSADEAIFGLMVMNDLSARALQMHEMKLNLGPAKGKDFATALGPYLVPKSDLAAHIRATPRGSHFDLKMSARHNGETVASGNLGDMHFTFAEILCRASYGVTLHPGEVIGSGTVGTGCFLETNGSKIYENRWLKSGDTIDCEVEELGCLQNLVEKSPEPESR